MVKKTEHAALNNHVRRGAPPSLRHSLRRAVAAAVAAIMLALCVGLGVQTWRDAGDEARSAQAVGQLLAKLATLPRDEQGARDAIRWVQDSEHANRTGAAAPAEAPPTGTSTLRHLRLRIDSQPSDTAPSLPVGPTLQPLYVILEPNRAAEVQESLRAAIWLLLLTAVAGGLVVLLLRRRLALMFEALNDWQSKWSAFGGGDRHARLADPPFAELQPVSDAFNQLAEQLEQTLAQQEHLARQALSLRDDERRWISHELHDELAQWLTALSADAALIDQARRHGQAAPADSVQALRQGLADLRQNVRDLLHRLSPHGLGSADLIPALQAMQVRWQQRQPACTIGLDLPDRHDLASLGDAQASALGAICQEALTNAFRHGTPSNVHVSLRVTPADIRLRISNDIDAASLASALSHRPGLGSYSMQERARQLGGDCRLGPSADGLWRVDVSLPSHTTAATHPVLPSSDVHRE